jgi:hypothetical protein
MFSLFRLTDVVSLAVRLGVIALVAFVIIQQFGEISMLGPLNPYEIYKVIP